MSRKNKEKIQGYIRVAEYAKKKEKAAQRAHNPRKAREYRIVKNQCIEKVYKLMVTTL